MVDTWEKMKIKFSVYTPENEKKHDQVVLIENGK